MGGADRARAHRETRGRTRLADATTRPDATEARAMSNDPIVMYGALAFAAVLAIPILRFLAKQLGQLSGAPGAGTVVGGGYGGKTGSFTLAEVAKHASRDDVWVVIKDKVYDLSDFIDEHPGGVESIMKRAGGDATEGFFGPQHPSRVHDMIDEYLIGDVVAETDKDK
jgi:cytochrome b involved in lipid metabolism